MIRKLYALLVLSFGLLGLSACSGIEPLAAVGISSVAVIITEDKLPTDLIADAVTNQDCNSIRKMEDKGPLCRDKAEETYIETPVFCYRTLGTIECYDKRDPNNVGAQHIR